MNPFDVVVLAGYASLLVELAFLALPSEASVYQLFFPPDDAGSGGALVRARRRAPAVKVLAYLFPTALGVGLFLVPLAALAWPSVVEHLVPFPALDTTAMDVLGTAAILVGRVVTFASVQQLKRMRSAPGVPARGLFRWSRNPGLLGMYAFYVGNACLLPCAVLFAGFLPYAYNMHRRVLMEESHLVHRLGARYRAYLERVPRYLGRRVRS